MFIKKYLHFHKHNTLIFLLFFLQFIFSPFYFLSFLHYLSIKPFSGKYLFKKINFFSIITAGGTGGHIFPAMRLASYFNIKGKKIRFVCDSKTPKLLSKIGYIEKNNFFYTENAFECPNSIPLTILNIKPVKKNIQSLANFIYAMWQSFIFMLLYGALVQKIIGFGGYASFPMMFWGVIFRKKIYIHEQNTVFGKVNRIFMPFAHKIFTTFPVENYPTQKNIYHTGMPVPYFLENKQSATIKHDDILRILVISGSSGINKTSDAITSAIIAFASKYKGNIHIYHQASKESSLVISEKYKENNISHTIQPFFENIYSLLPQVNLCISRSGASSIVDLLTFSIPTIFMPLENSAENHQLKNALWVVKHNLGFLYKPWESNFYNLSALMYFALTSGIQAKLQKASAIKLNARSLIFHHLY